MAKHADFNADFPNKLGLLTATNLGYMAVFKMSAAKNDEKTKIGFSLT